MLDNSTTGTCVMTFSVKVAPGYQLQNGVSGYNGTLVIDWSVGGLLFLPK